MEALGRLFDAHPVVSPVDLNTSGATGNPVDMKDCTGITFLVFCAAGTGGDELTITVREAEDGSGTNEQDLDTVTHYFVKTDDTLSGDETWSEVEVDPAGDVVTEDGTAEDDNIFAIYVGADEMSDGFTHLTLDIADDLSASKIGCILGIRHDLSIQRFPANLAAGQ